MLFDTIALPLTGLVFLFNLFILVKKFSPRFANIYSWSLFTFGLIGSILIFLCDRYVFAVPFIDTKFDFTIIILANGLLLKYIFDKDTKDEATSLMEE